jgi:hypothetical protein
MMSSKQTSFLLILSAFVVATFIVYFELKRIHNSTETFNECKNDTDCASGLKCKKNVCTK